MPQRKNGSNKNKKKGRIAKSRSKHTSHAPPSTASASAARRGGDPSGATMIPGVTPDFSEYKQRSPLSKNYGTIYTRYKEATNRFHDFMMDQTPEDVRGKPCVNALVPSADWMQEQQFTLPKSVLKDLKMAIRSRDRVAKSVFGGGDEGHKYFLSVLLYCWTVLIALPRSESARETRDEGERGADKSNRYAVLEEEIDDAEDAESDSDFLPSSPVARPEPFSEPMTLKELLDADDRHDATFFLLSLNELMGFVSKMYEAVTKNYKVHTSSANGVSLALVKTMLEAAMTTNMAIQQVHALEMALQAQHPHLSTPYRVLSAIVLPLRTQLVAGILKGHSAKKCSTQEILAFLGDCLEYSFRAPPDALNRKESVVADFCTAFEVDAEGTSLLEEFAGTIHQLVMLEVPSGPIAKEQAIRCHREWGNTSSTHSWLRSLKFIGGDRAIHHTIRLLQEFGHVIQKTPDDFQIKYPPGLFGPSWQPGQSRTIHGDLESLFLVEIMPQWVSMCRKGIIGRVELPFENELSPLFAALREYVKSPTKPVSWSLAFAAHAMLTAVMDSDAVVDKLAVFQKSVFDEYFDTVEWAWNLAQSEKNFCSSKKFVKNMGVLRSLKNLGNDAFNSRALWNPLCGGTTLLYVAYFGNLELGSILMDCHAQLRITLHLFNALLVNGLVEPGQVPFLDRLHNHFNASRGVWEGPLPERGQLVQRFWICFGMDAQDAKRMAEKAKRDLRDGRVVGQSPCLIIEDMHYMSFLRQRKANPIDPAELSTSFRRLCNRDFRGVQDNYCTPEERRRTRGTETYEFCVRSNDTMNAIAEEQHLLSLHWPSCGAILEQFVCSFSRVLQWDSLLSDAMAAATNLNDNRYAFAILFAQQLLGALDFADTPGACMSLEKPTILASADFLTTYFGQVDETKALWFRHMQ